MVKRKAPKPHKAPSRSASRTNGSGKRPHNVPLPGMEEVRDAVLNRICASIADTREKLNALRADDAADMQAALNRMRVKNFTTFRAHGVELARVPGEEKLRVRTSKETATAETETDDEGDDIDLADGPEGAVE